MMKEGGEFHERLSGRNLVIGLLGAIGAGKSTLAGGLRERFGLAVLEEDFPKNPFLERFYEKPQEFSLRSQVWFLEQKVEQMRTANFSQTTVIDPAIQMDYIYAATHQAMGWLSQDEFSLYRDLYSALEEVHKLPKPDLLVCTRAPLETLVRRIRKRARPYEMRMLSEYPEYLEALSKAVNAWISQNRGVPVICVNSAKSDLSSDLVIDRIGERVVNMSN